MWESMQSRYTLIAFCHPNMTPNIPDMAVVHFVEAETTAPQLSTVAYQDTMSPETPMGPHRRRPSLQSRIDNELSNIRELNRFRMTYKHVSNRSGHSFETFGRSHWGILNGRPLQDDPNTIEKKRRYRWKITIRDGCLRDQPPTAGTSIVAIHSLANSTELNFFLRINGLVRHICVGSRHGYPSPSLIMSR